MTILDKLAGGDLRSIGRTEEVVQDIMQDPSLFGAVFEGITHANPIIRMRAADAIEKVSAKYPDYLAPFKDHVLGVLSKIEQQEVQWHVAQLLSYLALTTEEQKKAVTLLEHFLDSSQSHIVKVNAMQTLAELAVKNPMLKQRVLMRIHALINTGIPSLISRGKTVLRLLQE